MARLEAAGIRLAEQSGKTGGETNRGRLFGPCRTEGGGKVVEVVKVGKEGGRGWRGGLPPVPTTRVQYLTANCEGSCFARLTRVK